LFIAADLGRKQEIFEDAVENSSARLLTKRSPSLAKPPPEENKAGEKSDEPSPKIDEAVVKGDEEEERNRGKEKPERTPLSPVNRFSQASGASLDNVNLNEEVVARAKGTWTRSHRLSEPHVLTESQRRRARWTRSRRRRCH